MLTPESTVREAARLMLEHDCGCLPVVEKDTMRLIGVVTDRDIACRCVAQSGEPDTQVKEVMTIDPRCCHPEDDVAAVEQIMSHGLGNLYGAVAAPEGRRARPASARRSSHCCWR